MNLLNKLLIITQVWYDHTCNNVFRLFIQISEHDDEIMVNKLDAIV